MPFDSNGRFSLVNGYLAVTGQTILASQHNPPLEDIASGLSVTLLRTGVAPMLADLPMGGFKATNMGAGVAGTDAATVGQVSALAAAAITGAATKSVPIDADSFSIIDSAAGNVLKRVTLGVLKTILQPFSTALTAFAATGAAVAGDILVGISPGAWGRLAKGTDGQILHLASGLPAWAAGPVFTKSFESTQQTITLSGPLTLPHGLGTTPKLYMAVLQCTTNDGAYVVGNEVIINPNMSTTDTSGRGISIIPNATNMVVRYGDTNLRIIDADGTLLTIINSRWRLVVRAWA